MKKLIFLLLVMALGAGIVFAGTIAYPPGVNPENAGVLNPIAALTEYSVQQGVVTQPTVLVMVSPVTADLSGFETAVLTSDNFIAIRPHSGLMIGSTLVSIQPYTSSVAASYYLLL